MIGWCDRDNYKTRLQKWYESKDESSFIICVLDQRELTDVVHWIKDTIIYSCGVSIYESDVAVFMCGVLEQLIYDLGERDKFTNYYTAVDALSRDNNISVIQGVGNNASAEEAIIYDLVSQTSIINVPQAIDLSLKKDFRIECLLDEFIKDIKEILKTEKTVLFLIKFGKDGLDALSSNFKHWLLNVFCRKFQKIDGVKICILNSKRLEDIGVHIELHEYIPDFLEYSDVAQEARKHLVDFEMFSITLVDIETQRVSYTEFSRKLFNVIKVMEGLKE